MKMSEQRFILRIFATSVVAVMCFAIASSVYSGRVNAQQTITEKPLMLMVWYGPGAVALPVGKNWKFENLTLHDNGSVPVALFKKIDSGLNVSFIIFEDPSGKPSSEGCREDAINPILSMLKNKGMLVSN